MSEPDFTFEPTVKEDWEEGYDDNGPTLSTLANAIQCWALLNEAARDRCGITVQETALAFAITPERVIQAVEWHPWMFLSGDGVSATIEHEGE